MQFTREFKVGIRAGKVTRSYRVWKKPQAKVGGRYNLHPEGAIEVTAMARVMPSRITDREAVASGFTNADELRSFLDTDEEVYLLEFSYLGPDLVGQPERDILGQTELDALIAKLEKMDARSEQAWTGPVLDRIARDPGHRAGDLAPSFGWDKATFKRQVRKLKALGLTRSLETGYELSDRGRQVRKARR